MGWISGHTPLLSVVVPVYDVAPWLPECLDSVLASSHANLDVVVVDDGSRDGSGAIADSYARRDRRVSVIHTENRGLGAARNEGLRHARGRYLAFCDSDDAVPRSAYATLLASLATSRSDFVTGSVARWDDTGLHCLPWMRRLHAREGSRLRPEDHPEILGDVFAWNKVFRRRFWDRVGLCWPEGLRYEDQPTTTRAYLAGRFDVIGEIVYHWRSRSDGSSITQQRAQLNDLSDRLVTKRLSLESVREHGSREVQHLFVDRVLAGDVWRYLALIPGCSDDWWLLLRAMVLEFWSERSLAYSGLPPLHRLAGWLVEQDRRAEAAAVMEYAAAVGGPLPRLVGAAPPRLDLPASVLDIATVAPVALALRPHEL